MWCYYFSTYYSWHGSCVCSSWHQVVIILLNCTGTVAWHRAVILLLNCTGTAVRPAALCCLVTCSCPLLQINAVRAIVPNKSNNEIILVLQHFDNCVDKTVQAFMEGKARLRVACATWAAAVSWQCRRRGSVVNTGHSFHSWAIEKLEEAS